MVTGSGAGLPDYFLPGKAQVACTKLEFQCIQYIEPIKLLMRLHSSFLKVILILSTRGPIVRLFCQLILMFQY